jgi:hypothetical protein
MPGIVLALMIALNHNPAETRTFQHVRSADPVIRALLAEGYERSATLRRLVDTTEALSCIVYVVPAVKLPEGVRGALLHWSAGSAGLPILRVVVKPNSAREEAIATIAHELQHVIEAVTASKGGEIDMTAAFDALDPLAAGQTGVRQYETAAAMEVTAAVRRELRLARGERPHR